MICLVCYDISSDKTRREIVKLLSDYGKRVQESVFLCSLSAERVYSLDNKLRAFYARKKHATQNKPKTAKSAKQKNSIGTITQVNVIKNVKAKGKNTPDNQNNTLEIMMINMEPETVNAALVLGTPIDSTRSYAVI